MDVGYFSKKNRWEHFYEDSRPRIYSGVTVVAIAPTLWGRAFLLIAADGTFNRPDLRAGKT